MGVTSQWIWNRCGRMSPSWRPHRATMRQAGSARSVSCSTANGRRLFRGGRSTSRTNFSSFSPLRTAERTKFNLLAYRCALREMLDYTSHGYIFHPVPLKDGRVAIAAIGSGYEGSGDPDVRSKRNEYGMDRVLKLREALKVRTLDLDHEGQIGYFVECILGGMHGVGVGDLMGELQSELCERLMPHLRRAVPGERERFMKATSLNPAGYAEAFGGEPHPSVASLLAGC